MTITAETNPETATQGDRSEQIGRSRELAEVCARVADECRARDVRILDLTEVTPVFDFFVICSGNTRRQMHAVAEEVDRAMKERGSKRIGVEGYDTGNWILQDYGDVVLHVFTDETRETYDLEGLWADAKIVDWQPPGSTTE